jgi:hypothetical protein
MCFVKCKVFEIFFSISGVVNRGDSFRRRRSRSNSLAPGTVQHDSTGDVTKNYRTAPGNNGSSGGGASTGDNLQVTGTDQQQRGQQQQQQLQHHHHHSDVRTYRVAIIGAHGVGKSALVGQFMSSDCINAYDRVRNGKTLPNKQIDIYLVVANRVKKVNTISNWNQGAYYLSPAAAGGKGETANLGQRRLDRCVAFCCLRVVWTVNKRKKKDFFPCQL